MTKSTRGRHRSRVSLLLSCVWLGGALCATALPAAAATDTAKSVDIVPVASQLTPNGRWLTDEQGRVVVIHGTNMINKLTPFTPRALGFGDADLKFLAENGINGIRLGFIWAAVEPQPGVYDDKYIDKIVDLALRAEAYGITPVIDFHQDGYSLETTGEGAPDWANLAKNVPAGDPIAGGEALFTSFWNDAAASDGIGLQEHYAAAWRHVAKRLRNVPGLNLEIMNEPYPATNVSANCFSRSGCSAFEQNKLGNFQRLVLSAIREVDHNRLVFVEPQVGIDLGAKTYLQGMNDSHTGYAFHDYDFAGFIPTLPSSQPYIERPLNGAENRFLQTGEPALLYEFGANSDPTQAILTIKAADAHMMSWMHWAYWAQDYSVAQTYGLLVDISKGPKGDNVNQGILDAISEPSPRLFSGTPTSWAYNSTSGTFTATYTTTAPGASHKFAAGAQSIFFMHPRFFPNGYKVAVTGGYVTSEPNAKLLTVASYGYASDVKVIVKPVDSK